MRAVQKRREQYTRLSAEALGLSPQARIFAREVESTGAEAALLRLPIDTRARDPLQSAAGEPLFMFGYSAFGGDDPFG